MFLRLAWRNLWRNGRRTALTLGTVVLGTAVLVVVRALMDGMGAGAVRNATDLLVGEAQVHAPGWLADRSLHQVIRDPAAVLAAADAAGVAATPRSYGYGLVAHATRSAGALFWGVDPSRERVTVGLARHVAAGQWLATPSGGGAVLGGKLARTLGVGVGDELVVVVQAADGSLGNELFTVSGILEPVGETVDRSAVILPLADWDTLFVGGGRIHEIVLNGHGAMDPAAERALAARAAPAADVRTWRQLMPMLSDMLAMIDASLWIMATVFGLAAGLGVMNTMLMATWDRMPELGVLRALGTTPWQIARDVTAEALLLGALGAVLGAAVGGAGAWLLQIHGIDTRAFAGETSIAGVPFDPIWRAQVSGGAFVQPVLAMGITCVLAALYPAVLAARLEPVRAMQRV